MDRGILKDIDWIVFDVDGVLIDASGSFDVATKLTVENLLNKFGIKRDVSLNLLRKLRSKGSFGDDFKLSEAILSFYLNGEEEKLVENFPEGEGIDWIRNRFGRVVDEEEIVKIFNTFYLGEEYEQRVFDFDGLWKRERRIVDVELLKKVEKKFKIGVITGRNRKEMELSERVIGFRFKRKITREMGLKPDPDLLFLLVGKERGIYIGDTLNDEIFVSNFNKKYERDFKFFMVGRGEGDVNHLLSGSIKSVMER